MFRFPAGRGERATLYRLPDLEPVAWRFESGGNTAQPVGFVSDEDLVYSLSTSQELIALDLASGRSRVVDTSVAMATLGPDGTPHFIRTDGSVASIERRSLHNWTARFDSLPRRIWGGVRGRLLALYGEGETRGLHVVAPEQPTVTQTLPGGHFAVAPWGDVAAIATDSGVVVIDPVDSANRGFAPLPGAARIAFSPSAHRMYVMASPARLLTLERFDLVIIDEFDLPGPVETLRLDQLGKLILLRPTGVDSVRVMDIVNRTILGTAPTEWDDELPVIAFDGTLVTRWDGRIRATAADAMGEQADAPGSDDRWLSATWDPRRPGLELSRESAAQTASQPGQLHFVQVSSTHNTDWALEFAQNLRRAGVEASVLPPGPGEELYRVVLGPYPTREAAENTAQKLNLPFWIYTADASGTPDSTSQFQQ